MECNFLPISKQTPNRGARQLTGDEEGGGVKSKQIRIAPKIIRIYKCRICPKKLYFDELCTVGLFKIGT